MEVGKAVPVPAPAKELLPSLAKQLFRASVGRPRAGGYFVLLAAAPAAGHPQVPPRTEITHAKGLVPMHVVLCLTTIGRFPWRAPAQQCRQRCLPRRSTPGWGATLARGWSTEVRVRHCGKKKRRCGAAGAARGENTEKQGEKERGAAGAANKWFGTSTCTTVRSDRYRVPRIQGLPAPAGWRSRALGRRWTGRAQGGGGGGGGSVLFTNPAVARLFGTLLASSRRDANRTRRAQSGAR
eukprot:gene23886-biopygen7344